MTHNAKAIKSRKLWHLIKMRLGNGRTPKRIKRSSNWDENTVRNISFASEISIKTANPCLPKTQRLWIVESGWIHHTFCFVFFSSSSNFIFVWKNDNHFSYYCRCSKYQNAPSLPSIDRRKQSRRKTVCASKIIHAKCMELNKS